MTSRTLRRCHRPATVALVSNLPVLTRLQFDLDPDAAAGADGSLLGSLIDSSGNSRTATASAGHEPTLNTGVVNGHSVSTFTAASSTHLKVPGFTSTQPYTEFLVMKVTTASVGYYMADGDTVNTAIMFRSAGNAWQVFAGAFVTGPASDLNWHIFCRVMNGASSNLRVDGGAGTAGNPGAGNPGGFTWGAGGNTTTGPMNGQGARAARWSGALSLSDINTIGGYLGTRYGLTWTTAT